MFYLVFYVVFVLSVFDLSSICYDVILFVVLLYYFICMKGIQIVKIDLIDQIYQMMIINILKN